MNGECENQSETVTCKLSTINYLGNLFEYSSLVFISNYNMKKWLDIRENQIGLLFAIVHWTLILLFILIWKLGFFVKPDNVFFNFIFGISAIVTAIILVIDSFAVIPAALLWSPFYFFGDFKTFGYGVISMSFFTISFEWILIGRYFYDRHTPLETKLKTLSIIDD